MFRLQGPYPTPQVSRLRAELETLSKDQLIDLLLEFSERSTGKGLVDLIQNQISTETTHLLRRPDAVRPFDLPWEVHEYTRLPADPRAVQDPALQAPWRIALISFDLAHSVIGLETWSNVVIGRAEEDSVPDLDLTTFHAVGYGVSRRHAVLRPTDDDLLLIDLESKNGTRKNDVPLEPFEPHVLQDRDVIAFGALQFQLRIVGRAG
jgi:hypothetical protein